MGKWLLCIGVSLTCMAFADASIQQSFETSYLQLQKRIEALKQKGNKVTTQTEKEINDLLVQMNHEHTQLKRQLEVKNQLVTDKIEKTKWTVSEDWPRRLERALTEIGSGLQRAWNQLNKSSPTSDEESL